MAACRASTSLLYCRSSAAGTFICHFIPSKLAVVSKFPKSRLLLSKDDRACIAKHETQSKYKFLVHAEYSDRKGGGAGDFAVGFVLGGLIFGALGYLFAPQVTKVLSVAEREFDSAKKLPKGLDEDEGLEKTRRSLNEKIAQLNAAIDDVSAQLRADDKPGGQQTGSTSEIKSAA